MGRMRAASSAHPCCFLPHPRAAQSQGCHEPPAPLLLLPPPSHPWFTHSLGPLNHRWPSKIIPKHSVCQQAEKEKEAARKAALERAAADYAAETAKFHPKEPAQEAAGESKKQKKKRNKHKKGPQQQEGVELTSGQKVGCSCLCSSSCTPTFFPPANSCCTALKRLPTSPPNLPSTNPFHPLPTSYHMLGNRNQGCIERK